MDVIGEKSLSELYESIWSKGKAALANSQIALDPLPKEGDVRWGLSAVLLPGAWHADLKACAQELAPILGDGSFIYGPECLHITLRSFEGYREYVAEDDEYMQVYVGAISHALTQMPSMSISLRGLIASPGGVLIKGWPGMDLQAFRQTVHEYLARTALPMWGPESELSRIRTSAHATLSIFQKANESCPGHKCSGPNQSFHQQIAVIVQ